MSVLSNDEFVGASSRQSQLKFEVDQKNGKKGELNYPLFEKKQNLTDHRFKYTESIATKSVSCDQNCCCVLDESF